MKTGIIRRVVPYAGPILLCLALGALASWLQQGALETWYPYLRKSPLTPPGYVFPVAWTLLYVLSRSLRTSLSIVIQYFNQ